MYLFLESISELLDRFSLVIVGGLLGMLIMGLIWRKMPKSGPKITKNERRVEATENLRKPINLLIWSLYIAISAFAVMVALGIFVLVKLLKGF